MEAWKEELYHYGTPKHSGRYPWGSGDRPYQGDAYAALRSKTKRAVKATVKYGGRALSPTIKGGKDKPNVSPVEKIAKNNRDIASSASNLKRRKEQKSAAIEARKDASLMTNDQLRKAIERMNLENQYVDKKSSAYVEGENRALEILDTIGDVAGIAASMAGIASIIYKVYKG